MEPDDRNRITVSEDKLRAVLAEFELRLTRAFTGEVRALEAKLDAKVGMSEFVTLQDRVGNMEAHGSKQAIDALSKVTDLQAKLHEVEVKQLGRDHLVAEQEADHLIIESLVGWRNRLVGGFMVLTFLVGVGAWEIFIR